MKCPECGSENVDNAKFCKDCGKEFPKMCPYCGNEMEGGTLLHRGGRGGIFWAQDRDYKSYGLIDELKAKPDIIKRTRTLLIEDWKATFCHYCRILIVDDEAIGKFFNKRKESKLRKVLEENKKKDDLLKVEEMKKGLEKDPKHLHDQLLRFYSTKSSQPKRFLDHEIKNLMKEGLKREEAIRQLALKEKIIEE